MGKRQENGSVRSRSPDADVRREQGVFGMCGAQSPARDSVQNHRGMVWVGKHLRDHPGRSMGRDTSNQTRLLRAPSSPSLDTSRFGKFSLYLLIFIVGSIFITVLIKRLRGSSACARGNTRDGGSGTGCDAPQSQHFPPAASPGIQLKSSWVLDPLARPCSRERGVWSWCRAL